MTIREDSFEGLHSEFKSRVIALAQNLALDYKAGLTKVLFKPFETLRGPERQAYLRSRGVSKAGPGQSPHEFGLATDFVPFTVRTATGRTVTGWTWNIPTHEWDYLKRRAEFHGLEAPIWWDRPHVQMPKWRRYKPQRKE